ncbi:MAG: heme ABC transporter ATP-binding protein [Candidatus Omnitrophica bacterium]|nr:heme ABC transporter ATP-binding protein [Candidatus Omnitrophota bacterium]
MSTDILTIKNLFCGYGSKDVIHNISFSVAEGEFVGIIGPNGAGKTTLFKAVTKLLHIRSGEVIYRNKDVNRLSAREIAEEIAVLPQGVELNFSFTVEEFILMGRYPHKKRFEGLSNDDYAIIENVMSLTDTQVISRRFVNELSGGEKQRVLLAQALAQEPKLLLLDEPTSHLDIGHQISIMELLKNLNKKQGITVLAVLHDLNLAAEYADRLILLNKGEVFRSGDPREVLTYQNIEDVYQTVVVVRENPFSRKPYILLATKERIDEKRTGVDLHR